MPVVQREVHRFQQFLAGQGLKLTNERAALVREIFSTHYHFEADELLFKIKRKMNKPGKDLFVMENSILGLVNDLFLAKQESSGKMN